MTSSLVHRRRRSYSLAGTISTAELVGIVRLAEAASCCWMTRRGAKRNVVDVSSHSGAESRRALLGLRVGGSGKGKRRSGREEEGGKGEEV